MGKYKYTFGVESDAQSGKVLDCDATSKDRKAAAIPGEAADIEQTTPVRRRPRSRAVSGVSIPKRFVPEKMSAVEPSSI